MKFDLIMKTRYFSRDSVSLNDYLYNDLSYAKLDAGKVQSDCE